MIKSPAPFPHAGSQALLRDGGGTVRIIQPNADGTYCVSGRDADGAPITRTVLLVDLIPADQQRSAAA